MSRPAEARAELSRAAYVPAIQGLRAVAILLVVAFHAGLPVPGGFIGVDVFFVISGFVIGGLLLRRADTGALGLVDFYLKRARRIVPPLALMLVVTLAVSVVVLSPIETLPRTGRTGKWATVGAGNFGVLRQTADYFTPTVPNPLAHTWSLGVEEQFYLVLPVVVLVLAWSTRGRPDALRLRLGVVSSTLALASLAWCLHRTFFGADPIVGEIEAFFDPFARAWEFLLGVGIACLGRSLRRRTATLAAWLGAAGLALSALLIHDVTPYPGLVALAPVAATALLVLGGPASSGLIGRVLGHRSAVWIGDRSYAWYLWHWPFITFATLLGAGTVGVLAAAAVSLPVAAFTHRRWDEPIRRREPPRLRGALTPLACVAVSLALAQTVVATHPRLISSATVDFARQTLPYGHRLAECQNLVPLDERDLGPCTFAGTSTARPVILLGDSNAGQYSTALFESARETGRTFTIATAPYCPALDLAQRSDRFRLPDCTALFSRSIAWLEAQPASIVILSAANEQVDDSDFQLGEPGGELTDDVTRKARLWASALEDSLRAITEAGHTVVHVDSIPHFGGSTDYWRSTRCALITLTGDPRICGESARLADLLEKRRHGIAAERAAVDRADVRRLDLTPVICPEGRCSTNDGDFWIYRDGLHLSQAESRRLAPEFTALLADLP